MSASHEQMSTAVRIESVGHPLSAARDYRCYHVDGVPMPASHPRPSS